MSSGGRGNYIVSSKHSRYVTKTMLWQVSVSKKLGGCSKAGPLDYNTLRTPSVGNSIVSNIGTQKSSYNKTRSMSSQIGTKCRYISFVSCKEEDRYCRKRDTLQLCNLATFQPYAHRFHPPPLYREARGPKPWCLVLRRVMSRCVSPSSGVLSSRVSTSCLLIDIVFVGSPLSPLPSPLSKNHRPPTKARTVREDPLVIPVIILRRKVRPVILHRSLKSLGDERERLVSSLSKVWT